MLRQTIPKLPRHLLKSATHFGSDFQSTQTPFQDNSHKRHSRRITTMAAPDVASLLRSLDKWDQAWAKHDPNELQKLLAPDCTLHADGVLFENDLKGADAILDIHKRYFSTFDFNHEPIACAANPETRSGFAFWQDHNVRRKEGDQGAGTSIAGMWKAVFNQDCSAIQDIYFLRQLHQEEAEHKLKDPKSIAKGGVDSSRYPKAPATMTATESEAQKHKEEQKAARYAAEQYSKIWQTGDTSIAEKIMDENVKSTDLMHGGELQGRQSWCDMIKKVFENWKPTTSSYDVGVSLDGRVALVHWISEGAESHQGAEPDQNIKMFGLNMLQINPENGKIVESIGFRQLSPVEREMMMKPDAFKRAKEQ
ncbi:hypothetical protein Ndes2437A_g01164 [Nannochloris sp. 'desiccata']|nr:hypothetical protein KSW81_006259 [Chlorella desiccata (nom. nud.)]